MLISSIILILTGPKMALIFTSLFYIHILRIDNSRHGAIHVLWYILRTTKAATSCDISNERAHFSACLGASCILMTFYLKKRQT